MDINKTRGTKTTPHFQLHTATAPSAANNAQPSQAKGKRKRSGKSAQSAPKKLKKNLPSHQDGIYKVNEYPFDISIPKPDIPVGGHLKYFKSN